MKPQEWQDLKELDAQIRTIEKPTKDFDEWVIDIGLFESLGEQGGDILTQFYKKEPTVEEIKADVKEHLSEQKEKLSKKFVGYIPNVLSGREEMQLKVLEEICVEI
jgi:hypothetical protein